MPPESDTVAVCHAIDSRNVFIGRDNSAVAVGKDAVLEPSAAEESVHSRMAELATVIIRTVSIVHHTRMGIIGVCGVSIQELRVSRFNTSRALNFHARTFAGIRFGAVAVAVRVAAPRIVRRRREHDGIRLRAIDLEMPFHAHVRAADKPAEKCFGLVPLHFDNRAFLDCQCRALPDGARALDFVHPAADPCRVVRDVAADDDAAHDARYFLRVADRAV